MKATFRIETTEGETLSVTTAVSDFIRWERQYKRKTSELLESWSLEDWTYLAWASLRRSKGTSLSFDDWQAGVLSVELADGEETRPTPPVASAG